MIYKAQSPAGFAEEYIVESIWSGRFPPDTILPAERELSELIGRLDNSRNAIFCSVIKGQIVGSISVDGQQADPNTARMRWFITDAEYTGRGIGRTLIERALRHCEGQGLNRVVLSSFEGLDPARALYESFGFKLMTEQPGQQYGAEVLEQEFERIVTS